MPNVKIQMTNKFQKTNDQISFDIGSLVFDLDFDFGHLSFSL